MPRKALQTGKVVTGDSHESETKKPGRTPGLEKETEKLEFSKVGEKLLNSVIEQEKEVLDDGRLLGDALDNSIYSFVPDMMFEQMAKDYAMAKKIYGEKILREVSGYDEDYLENNIRLPEFRRELRKSIEKRLGRLKKDKLLDKKFSITEKGLELASLVMYTDELDRIAPKGLNGKKVHRRLSVHGDRQDIKNYARGDRYRDISVHKTVKTAVRRGHSEPVPSDIRVFHRNSKGEISIIFALDASGSMKGDKLSSCKKAGIALCYKAIEEKDMAGLIVFGKDIHNRVLPTRDFTRLLKEIASIRAASETDISKTIREAVDMFPDSDSTRHLVLITDAMPTAGREPEKKTIEAASLARANGITISLVGIKLSEKAKGLAEKIVQVGMGRLHIAKDTENIDWIVLEDYYAAKEIY